MKTPLALAGLILALLPSTAPAAPAHARPVKAVPKAAALSECGKCHMKVSAAVAKKDHCKDPMDGGTLTPVRAAKKK